MLTSHLIRQLTLAADTVSPSFISAASGLCWLGEHFYVVADDTLHLGIFTMDHASPGRLLRLLPGALPEEHKDRKKNKPDFEVLTHWADYPHAAGGALLAFGSGSKPNRCTGVLIPLGEEHAIIGTPVSFDLSQLYTAIAKAVSSLNIEGALIQGDELWLMQRGNSDGGTNALAKLPLSTLQHCIDGRPHHLPEFSLQIIPLVLGEIDGVPLTVTDVTRLSDGTMLFSAAAENTSNAYDDGQCAGSAIGMLSPTGQVLRCEILSGQEKVEGIAARTDGAGISCFLVTDADDSSVAAGLRQLHLDF